MLASAAAALFRRTSRHRWYCTTAAVSVPSAIRKAAKDAPARNLEAIPSSRRRAILGLFSRRAPSSKTFASSSASVSSSSALSSNPAIQVKDFYDAIVVGGGHNGLVAALLLAREGGHNFKVALFDADDAGHLGGAARPERPFSTQSAAKNLRHSTGAYLLGPFPPELLDFCGLSDLPVVRRSPHYFLPPSPNVAPKAKASSKGGVFFYADDKAATQKSFLSEFSHKDWHAMKEMERELEEIRKAFAPAMLCPSPDTADDAAGAFFRSSSSSSSSASAFVSLVEGSVADYLNKFEFESETLKAMFCATDGLSGATASPYDRGTGEVFFYSKPFFSFLLLLRFQKKSSHFFSLFLSFLFTPKVTTSSSTTWFA